MNNKLELIKVKGKKLLCKTKRTKMMNRKLILRTNMSGNPGPNKKEIME